MSRQCEQLSSRELWKFLFDVLVVTLRDNLRLYSLLGEVFSKDDLSFPGKLSKTESQKRKLLAMEYLDIINEVPRDHIRTAKLRMLRERFPDVAVPDDNDASNEVIRFDLKFPGHINKCREPPCF